VRLDVDLAFDAAPGSTSPDAESLDLHRLAAAVRSPRTLGRLLRARHYDEVRVREGDLPLSAVQAVCLVLVGSARAASFVVDGRQLGRTAYLRRAVAKAAVAVPSELGRSVVLGRRVMRASRRPVRLPERAATPRRALYLRIDPAPRWLGLQVGGAATHTAGVINGLLDNGVAVEVLAVERPAGTERATFVQVPPTRTIQIAPGLAYTQYGEEIVLAAADRPTDFVYQRYQLGSDAGLKVADRHGVPLVLEFNGSELWVQEHWNPGGTRLAGPLRELERRNLRDASLVVVVSEPLRATAVAEGAEPARVLVNPNGVDVEALAPYRAGTPSQWRHRLEVPDELTVGFIGTFGLWHGVRLLPELADAVPDARWLIVGDGDLFAEVRAEMDARDLTQRVLMTGLVERPRALEFLACCDVLVSPHVPNPDGSPFFGSPTKIFEYMGLRRPIVASDLEQIGQVLEHERTALLCRPGDVEEAAAAVRRLLGDPALRDRLAEAAFQLAAAEYTWEAHARRILEALGGSGRASVGHR
jgi:glycosyltransferase involved in cell wall biosynthesis